MRAVEELDTDEIISDSTWEVLARAYNVQQLIEFPVLVGAYQGIAYLQNSLRVRLRLENEGLSAH